MKIGGLKNERIRKSNGTIRKGKYQNWKGIKQKETSYSEAKQIKKKSDENTKLDNQKVENLGEDMEDDFLESED